MAASRLPDPPDSGYLAWVVKKPEEVAAYLAAVAALSRLELIVHRAGQPDVRVPVTFSAENATLEITL